MAGCYPRSTSTVIGWNKSTHNDIGESASELGVNAMARKQIRKESGLSAENVDGNVDKIREILFGGQMRDYEQRFADLEARLTKNIEHISNAFEKRVERLNTFAKREIEKLAEQVKDERKAAEKTAGRGQGNTRSWLSSSNRGVPSSRNRSALRRKTCEACCKSRARNSQARFMTLTNSSARTWPPKRATLPMENSPGRIWPRY